MCLVSCQCLMRIKRKLPASKQGLISSSTDYKESHVIPVQSGGHCGTQHLQCIKFDFFSLIIIVIMYSFTYLFIFKVIKNKTFVPIFLQLRGAELASCFPLIVIKTSWYCRLFIYFRCHFGDSILKAKVGSSSELWLPFVMCLQTPALTWQPLLLKSAMLITHFECSKGVIFLSKSKLLVGTNCRVCA